MPEPPARVTLADILASGELDTYEPGPPRPSWVDSPSIDDALCARSTCEICGHVGLAYHPFTSRELGSYRAFAVCRCGAAQEF